MVLPILIVVALAPAFKVVAQLARFAVPTKVLLVIKLNVPLVILVLTSAVFAPPPPLISISFSNRKSPVILALPLTTKFLSKSVRIVLIPILPPI